MTNDALATERDVVTEVRETKVGLKILNDFNNLFGYNLNIPSLVVGENKKLTKEQLNEKYPLSMKYLDNVSKLTKLVKTFGGKVDVDSYAFRAHHISGMEQFLNVVSRLQAIKVIDQQIQVYIEEDVGWGLLEVRHEFENNVLVKAEVYLGDKKLDLSKPIKIQAINWEGELVSGIQLYDRNAGKPNKELLRDEQGVLLRDPETGDALYEDVFSPINPTIQISDDDLGNSEHYKNRWNSLGAINKSDIQQTMQTSPLDYLVMRVTNDDVDEELSIMGFRTPLFLHLDYHYDIPYLEHIKALEDYNELKEQDLDYNSRNFAGVNLFRWGSLDPETWKRGLAIYNAVLKSPKINPNSPDNLIDNKLLVWADANIESLKAAKADIPGVKIDDEAIAASSVICNQASVLSRSFFITKALIVTDIEEDDLGFRHARIAFRSRPMISRRFQSIARTPTDLYKIVELDDDNNIIGIINPIDIFAIVQYATESTVVEFKADFIKAENDSNSAGQNEVDIEVGNMNFYNAINSYKA